MVNCLFGRSTAKKAASFVPVEANDFRCCASAINTLQLSYHFMHKYCCYEKLQDNGFLKKISMLEIMLYETRYDDHSVLKKKDPGAVKCK